MRTAKLSFVAMAVAALSGAVFVAQGRTAPPRPNFLIIVADDLGYSDVGAFGGEIATPNIDALARAGVRLTGFHTAPTCSPTRAMLLTGADSHEVGMGTMAEALTPALRDAGYEGELNDRAATVAQLLHKAGYFTAQAGKWHLGLTEARSPAARGFERSFALLPGGGDHFGADQEGQPYLFLNGHTPYREDGKLTRYPVGSYSADVFTDRMLAYLKEGRKSRRPFFAYLTYTEPHWPLQAPDDIIDKYKGRYDDGPEALRDRRLARMKALGVVPADVRPHPMMDVKPWADLTPQERAVESRKMEVYAAMVDRMDQNIGRMIKALKASGQYDNTVIIFISDNGAEGSTNSRAPVPPPAEGGVPIRQPDNSLANIGRVGSFIRYGPTWAQAGSAPSRLYKGFTTEGGIHTPAIVVGPGIRGGRMLNAQTHVADITPTLLELAGVKHPAVFEGRRVLPVRGRSWTPLLYGRARAVRTDRDLTGWELFYGRAMRQGDWKVVYVPVGRGLGAYPGPDKSHWELFNLRTDPGETTDLGPREPRRLAMLTAAWDAYAKQVGIVVTPPPGPPPAGEP